MLLIDKSFKGEILSKLNQLRKEGILCDVTLRVEGQDFAAHRCVLAAMSPYFRTLFTCEFKLVENENNHIELQEISSAVAKEVLDFIYTGEARVNLANAKDLLMAADYFIIPNLKWRVAKYLENTIDDSNYLQLESVGVLFSCKTLENAAIAYKLQNFVTMVKSQDFKALDLEKVKELISHDEIIVSKEEEVYNAVISWVKHDVLARECLLPELLQCVRLFSMPKCSLQKILETEELVKRNTTCINILQKTVDFLLSPEHFKCKIMKSRKCLRKREYGVVLTGGHCKYQQCTRETYGFSLSGSTEQWAILSAMPGSRTRHAATLCDGQLYVVGGTSSKPATVIRFNPMQNKWCEVDSRGYIARSRKNCSATTYKEELYIIGGEGFWHSVVKFDPKHDNWTNLEDMTVGRDAHCAVAMENGICVIAGYDGEKCVKSVELYNPVNGEWSVMPDMTNARQFAAAAVISHERILVVGGYSDVMFEHIEKSCEIFDPAMNEWSLVSGPVVPRAACGIASFDNHLYLFGGEDQTRDNIFEEDFQARYLDSVECYDIQNNKWQIIERANMLERVSCLQATLMLLPTKFFNEYGDYSDSEEDPDGHGNNGDEYNGDNNGDEYNEGDPNGEECNGGEYNNNGH